MAAILAALLVTMASPALAGTTATTLYVAPGGDCAGHGPCYAALQAAVDAASSDDTILVAEGSYTGVSSHGSHVQVVYINKRITIRGGYTTAYAEPPDPVAHPTTLDAEGQGHVVYIPYLGSYAHLTLDGLRLTGGYASEAVSGDDTGGGIRADGTSGDMVTIQNCWIGDNTAEEGGAGGIAFDFTEIELVDSTVISNTGTGVILWQSDSPVLSGNTITGNSAGGVSILSAAYGDGLVIQGNAFIGNAGNGIYLSDIDSDGGNDIISSNTFDGNDRGLFANSIYGTILHIYGNTFHNNTNNNNCYAHWDIYGGGIRLQGGNAEVLNNTFTENYVCYGGGISVGNGGGNAVLIQGNTFLSNSASMGGAIHLEGDGNTADVQGNLISGNQAHDGGGLSIDVGAQPTVRRNVMTGNQVAGYGGALYCGSCTVTLEQNRITGNHAGTGGGLSFGWPAVAIPQTVSTLTNNLIADNSAATAGGVMVKGSRVALIHNTIARNLGGAGVHVVNDYFSAAAVLTNTILVSHSVGIQVASGSASLQGTLWGDGAWANGSDWVGTVVTGTVNLWGDPLFVAPGSGDYHITAGSPARDWGVDAGVSRDIDGEGRPHPDTNIPDIGADEYHLDDLRVFLPLVVRNR
jgi:parallel beta-helix repeat protein/predicted outer membrane repeat protein